jgi:hypothetical protein
MATRTISNTGGNYNSTATWVEGAVPTSADDVVATATSGQLTINVASAARTFNLTNYSNTITFNATWTISPASSGITNVISSGTTFAGTGTLTFTVTAAGTSITQNNTNRIPNLNFTSSAGTVTFNTDIYCSGFNKLNNVTGIFNGNVVYCNGDFGGAASTLGVIALSGTTKIVLDGSGTINYAYGGSGGLEINTTGTYSTNGLGVCLVSLSGATPSFSFIAGNFNTFNVVLAKVVSVSQDRFFLDIRRPINVLVENECPTTGVVQNMDITLAANSTIGTFSSFSTQRFYTTDFNTPIVNIRGGGLSASNVILYPVLRTTSVAGVNPSNPMTLRCFDLRLNSDNTHSFGSLKAIGGGVPNRPSISSLTASSQATLNLGDKETSQIIDYNFQDINASGGEEIVAINGTFSNTSNITSTYPSGGGVAGGSFTFVN